MRGSIWGKGETEGTLTFQGSTIQIRQTKHVLPDGSQISTSN